MRFSASTQSFYDDQYELNASKNDMPEDAKSISEDQYRVFFEAVNNGCRVYLDSDTFKVSEPKPDKYYAWNETKRQWILSEAAAQQKQGDSLSEAQSNKSNLLEVAAQSISVWQTKLLMGRALTEDETSKLNVWMDYIDAVSAVDTSVAPDINWPVKPA
ncbi:TPA: tail fiber assembly protein [Cronobacter dublinensis]